MPGSKCPRNNQPGNEPCVPQGTRTKQTAHLNVGLCLCEVSGWHHSVAWKGRHPEQVPAGGELTSWRCKARCRRLTFGYFLGVCTFEKVDMKKTTPKLEDTQRDAFRMQSFAKNLYFYFEHEKILTIIVRSLPVDTRARVTTPGSSFGHLVPRPRLCCFSQLTTVPVRIVFQHRNCTLQLCSGTALRPAWEEKKPLGFSLLLSWSSSLSDSLTVLQLS